MRPAEADDPVAANQRLWDARTPIHVRSSFYDVEAFSRGESSLHALEVREVLEAGSLDGKRLLHLQCHFGLDTLSWARHHGAEVVGVDFSGAAIAWAREIAAKTGVERAAFVQSDVRELHLDGEPFDVVYVSYGALCWLPELRTWADVVARHLRPGGFLYVAEIHPAAQTLNDEPGVSEMVVGYPYWTAPDAPLRFEEPGTYADVDADIMLPEYVWLFGLGDIVNAVIDAGLTVEWLREYPFTVYPQFPFLVEDADADVWRLPPDMPAFPLLFSLRARNS